jgi:hypothetical protein
MNSKLTSTDFDYAMPLPSEVITSSADFEEYVTIKRTERKEMNIFTTSSFFKVSLSAKKEIIRTKKGLRFCKVYTSPNGRTNNEYVNIN